jgi:hypothetical protein
MTSAARSQTKVYRYLWHNPGTSLKAAAKELHLSYAAVRLAKSRLCRRKDIHLLCPECFKPSLRSGLCHGCGYELDRPHIPLTPDFESQSPRYAIQPKNGLGSQTDYNRLGLRYGGDNIRHLVERVENPLLERARSELWQALKEVMPPDGVVEEANRVLTKDVLEFQARYPSLVRSPKATRQLVDNVLSVLAFRYPALRKCIAVSSVLGGDGYDR